MGFDLSRLLASHHLCAVLLCAASCLLPAVAGAQALPRNDGVTSSYGNSRTTVRAPAANGYWIPTPDGTNVRVHTNGPVAAPGGASANSKVYHSIPAAGASGWKRFLGKALKLLPLVGTGLMLWELFDDYGARPDGNGGLEKDPGVAPGQVTVTCWYGGWNTPANECLGSAQAAADRICASLGDCTQATLGGPSPFGGPYVNVYRGVWQNQFSYTGSYEGTRNGCTSGLDPRTGDGKCGTGVYQPATEEDLELMLAQMSATTGVPYVDAALDLLPFPIPNSAPLVDPANIDPVTLPPSTTTGPGGTTTTQRTYQGTPGGPGVINWNETTTTTTTDPQGNTTTTTTQQPPEPVDPCELNPNRLGCMEPGTADGPDVTNENKTITVTPMSGWGSDDASCPADVPMTLGGKVIPWSYAGMCQFASGIRPVVLALAWLVAAMIVIGVRTAD